MSHFPSTHLVTAFDSAKSQPLTGQRLAKIRYKTTKAQVAKFPSVCVSVPFIDVHKQVTDYTPLFPHIAAMLENAQDGIIRSLYESHEGNMTSVQDADISIEACIAFMEAESQGTRLTKEFIGAWFDSDVAEILQAAFVDKWSWDSSVELSYEQTQKLEQVTKAHKEMFAALAGGKTSYNIGQCAGLLKVLDLADTSDTAEKLRARLVGMSTKVDIAEML
jgi:hypothetical protein